MSRIIIAADETISYCIDAIKDYAFSCFGGRGGNHGVIFYPEEAYAIKKVMTSMAKAFQTTLHAIGEWLVWVANKGQSSMEGNYTVLTTKSKTLPMEDMTDKSGNTRMGMDCRDNTSLAC